MKKTTMLAMLCAVAGTQANAQWLTSGNATTPGDFLGTTNAMPIMLRVNNTNAGTIESNVGGTGGSLNTAIGYLSLNSIFGGMYNSAFGYEALYSSLSAVGNTGVGYRALYSASSGGNNTAVGYNALYANTAHNNTAIGGKALEDNTTGSGNTAVGNSTLANTTTGGSNTATGSVALHFNTTGSYNTATGSDALTLNTTGTNNTSNGWACLYGNTTGSYNTAMGSAAMNMHGGNYNSAFGAEALNSSSTGQYNTATGYRALTSSTGSYNTATGGNSTRWVTSGNSNTAIGYNSSQALTTGSNNVAAGYNALYNQTTGGNNVGLGYAAYPTNATTNTNWMGLGYNTGGASSASNMVELGNSSVTSIRQQVASTILSDGRVKENVKTNVPGLDFINRLRPVTYNLNIHRQNQMNLAGKTDENFEGKYDIEKMTMSGFIAQEVEKAAKDAGYNFSGVDKPATEGGLYGLRYSDFVMPLVKSVQELSAANETMKQQNEALQGQLNELRTMVLDMQRSLSQCCTNYDATGTTPLNGTGAATPVLEQNFPNPFSETTVIRCTVPGSFSTASVRVLSTTGAEVMSFPVTQAGTNTFNISGGFLAAGIYQYSLVIDGRTTDTKKMVLTK